MDHTTQKIEACEAVEGMSLSDLDNGYIAEVEHDPLVQIGTGLTGDIGRGMVLITFHDAEGNENYLLLAEDHPLNVYT